MFRDKSPLYVFSNRLAPDILKKQRLLLSTNRVEAAHLRTLRVTPKSKLMKNTYRSRCKSIALADTLGHDGARMTVAKALGYKMGPAAKQTLRNLQKKSNYHQSRQKSYIFKRARFLLHQSYRRLAKLAKLNVTDGKNSTKDHSYGRFWITFTLTQT